MNLKGLKRFSRIMLIALVMAGTVGVTGCKKKKELAAAEAAAAAQLAEDIAQAKEVLNSILADNTLDNIAENEQKLQMVRDMNLQDSSVLNLIIAAQEKIDADKLALLALEEEAARLEAEHRLAEMEQARLDLLNNQFEALTGEKDYDKSNQIINILLPLFASPDVPVLVIISEENGMKDYDRPTTIEKYLNYLKDRKAYKAVVNDIVYNDSGKITELELRRVY
jgi:PBP1b-binding outer membrane lipoprotein LpoB